jgi:hypothetical protein
VAQLGRDHQVAIALNYQRRAPDPGQALLRCVVRDAPFDDRVVLRVPGGIARRDVSSLLALKEPAEKLPALGLACLGVGEHDVENEISCLGVAAIVRLGSPVDESTPA